MPQIRNICGSHPVLAGARKAYGAGPPQVAPTAQVSAAGARQSLIERRDGHAELADVCSNLGTLCVESRVEGVHPAVNVGTDGVNPTVESCAERVDASAEIGPERVDASEPEVEGSREQAQ